ncbi:MAG: SdiA-regulated domain-containing protein [Woeseiaceae bacterium]|nr:SdiA-regulated domain-containing protein [Woeseiaceae bacterium]
MLLKRILVIALFLLASGCETADEAERQPQLPGTGTAMQQWRLPDALREISGLALTPDGRLLAVADEKAVIYELNYVDGKLVRAFAFEEPPLRGDFEGIAWLNDRVYLATSDGILYSAPAGADGEHVEAARTDTGLGTLCEIEGLAENTRYDRLYLVCKERRDEGDPEDLRIFEWSVGEQKTTRSIAVPVAGIRRQLGGDGFHPSGLVLNRANGHFLVVAARERGLAELDSDGLLIEARLLADAGRHRQPEGIELTSSGKLLLADEGGEGKARLAVYEVWKDGVSR